MRSLFEQGLMCLALMAATANAQDSASEYNTGCAQCLHSGFGWCADTSECKSEYKEAEVDGEDGVANLCDDGTAPKLGFSQCPDFAPEGYACPTASVVIPTDVDFIEIPSGEAFSSKIMEKLFNSLETYGPYQSCKVTISALNAMADTDTPAEAQECDVVTCYAWQTYQRNENIAIVGTALSPDMVYDSSTSALLWNRNYQGVLQSQDGFATYRFAPETSARTLVSEKKTWHLTITNMSQDEGDVGLIYANAIQLLSIAGAIAAILAF